MAIETLNSIAETRGKHSLEFIVSIDAEKETYRAVLGFARKHGLDFQVSWCGEYRGCSKAWNDAYDLSSGENIVLAADDLIFHPGWLEAAHRAMEQLGPEGGLVGFNDTQMDGENLATHYMMSRDFVENCLGGRVAWDCYKHSFNDVEATARAKQAGRFIYAPEAVVEHRHWIWASRPQDDTDRRNLGGWDQSRVSFNERQAAGFPD